MKSLNKARDILCLVAAEPGIGLSALARALGLPKSTAYRILRALESAGLVMQAGERHYSIGSLVHELASGSSRAGLMDAARPAMVHLRDECNETVALHVLQGAGWVVVGQVESRHELRRTITNLGVATPLHAGAAGKLFLAHLPEKERERYFDEHDLKALTPHTLTNRRRLLEELALIRRRGYSMSAQEVAIGVAGVVMPIKRTDGSAREALGVSGPLIRFGPRTVSAIRAGLEKAIADISERLMHAASPVHERLRHVGAAPGGTDQSRRKEQA